MSTIDRISQNTEFGGKRLLDGSMGANGTTVGDFLRFVSAEATTSATPEQGWKIDIQQIATRARKSGTVAIDVKNIRNGLQILLNEGGRSISLNTGDGQLGRDIEQILQNVDQDPVRFPAAEMSTEIRGLVVYTLNQEITENGLNLQVMETPDNKLYVQHTDFGDSSSFSVTSSVAGILSAEANIAQTAERGKNVEGTINGEIALGEGQLLTTLNGMEAAGITIKYDKELGFNEVPVLDEAGVKIGTKLVAQKIGRASCRERV